jgi:hypothetical protein
MKKYQTEKFIEGKGKREATLENVRTELLNTFHEKINKLYKELFLNHDRNTSCLVCYGSGIVEATPEHIIVYYCTDKYQRCFGCGGTGIKFIKEDLNEI